jgi:23S rRNA pseudouridine2457 synthase
MIIAFYKPFGVLSQFTSDGLINRTLAEFGFPPTVYPVGRLDADSEGLLLLSDEARIIHQLLEPRHEHPRRYWVQVEGSITEQALEQLRNGIRIQQYATRPCLVQLLDKDHVGHLPERIPPIRFRRHIPVSWLELELTEGKNRQVRRMTAAVGFPTLRLVRVGIGGLVSPVKEVGAWRELTGDERTRLLQKFITETEVQPPQPQPQP